MYITRADMEDSGLIPSSLPESVTDASFDVWIEGASREIDGKVGHGFPVLDSGYKFEGAPNAPNAIWQACLWLASAATLLALGVSARQANGPPAWQVYRKMALDDLKLIRAKELDVYGASGEDLDTETPVPIAVSAPATPTLGSVWDNYRIL